MTLTEFLLQRIAEDEKLTWTLMPYDCEPGCCAEDGWVGSQCRYCDASPVYGGTVEAMTASAEEHAEEIHQRARVLAECEAKRRIVALHTRTEPEEHECAGDFTGYSLTDPELSPCPTLQLLAAVYADHADYREEWRT